MSGPLSPGDHRVHLSHGGLDRSYLLHLPAASPPLPLVMMIHGAGGSADFAADETGWSRLADRVGFVVVYPEGMPAQPHKAPKFLTNPQQWNDGSGRGRHDDVGFLLAILDDLASLIDPRRVYVTGFSNGAGMTFRLAAEHADRIAAIGLVAGHFWVTDPKPSHAVPTIYMIGDSDPLVPLKGGTARTPWGKVDGRPPVIDTVLRWATALGLTPGTGPFQFHCIPRHGHHWPGGKGLLDERLGGPMSPDVDGTVEIWEFLKKYSLS